VSALAAILFLLILIVAVVVLLTVIFGGMMGPSFNRFNPFLTRSAASPDPACGNCGYATHGISSFECPECGADLREVGIVTPNTRRQGGSGCLLPVGFTVLVLILALGSIPAFIRHIPHHDVVQLNTGLYPNSQAYREIELVVTVANSYMPGSQPGGGSVTFSGGTQYSGSGANRTTQRTLSWSILQPPAEVRAIRVEVRPVTNATAWLDGVIEVDPKTLAYEWSDPQGNTHQGTSPLTDQEILAFLKACGADANDTGVQRESKELFALIDGMGKGMSNFTLSEFAGPNSMSSYTMSSGPALGWTLSYLGGWLALWILGLVLIARRSKRKAAH